jgi:hypothetical protein
MQHFPRSSKLPDSRKVDHSVCSLTAAMISRRTFLAVLAALIASHAFAELPHTPAAGSVERKGIADAMRKAVRKSFGEPETDIVFVFRELRVLGEWAWVEADPMRAGGNVGQFEGVCFLLRKPSAGPWRVAESLPDEIAAADEPRMAMRGWLRSLAAKYPTLPKGVLPAR